MFFSSSKLLWSFHFSGFMNVSWRNPSQFSAELREHTNTNTHTKKITRKKYQRWMFVWRAPCLREEVQSNQGSVGHLDQMAFDWRADGRAPATVVLQKVLGDPDNIICFFYSNLKRWRKEERRELSALSNYCIQKHRPWNSLELIIINIGWRSLVTSDD